MAFVNRKNPVKSGKTVVFFSVISIICFLLASSVLPFFAQSKNAPVPDILLCLVCVLPVYLDRKNACIFALVLGFLNDLFINEPISFSPVVFVAAIVIVMAMGRYFSRLGTLSIAVCTLPALALRMVIDIVCFLARFEGAAVLSLVFGQAFPQLVVNFACAIVLTFIIRFFAKRFTIYNIGI